jgi:hypothetical protein
MVPTYLPMISTGYPVKVCTYLLDFFVQYFLKWGAHQGKKSNWIPTYLLKKVSISIFEIFESVFSKGIGEGGKLSSRI